MRTFYKVRGAELWRNWGNIMASIADPIHAGLLYTPILFWDKVAILFFPGCESVETNLITSIWQEQNTRLCLIFCLLNASSQGFQPVVLFQDLLHWAFLKALNSVSPHMHQSQVSIVVLFSNFWIKFLITSLACQQVFLRSGHLIQVCRRAGILPKVVEQLHSRTAVADRHKLKYETEL